MTERTDEQLAQLLADSMAAHERDVDPGRARQLASAAQPPRGHWRPAAAAAAAVVILFGSVLYAVNRGTDHAAPLSGPTRNGGGGSLTSGVAATTTRENFRLAAAAARAALAALPLPPGAARLPGKPADWPPGGMGIAPSDRRLMLTTWWSTPLSVRQVASFLTAHAPAGMHHPKSQQASVGTNYDGIRWTEYDAVISAHPAAYTRPRMIVQFARVGDRTVLRADNFISPRVGVPEGERITAPVTAVQIDRTGPLKPTGGPGGRLAPVHLTRARDAAQIQQLVHGFNQLYGSLTGTALGIAPCAIPVGPWPTDKVTFVTTSSHGSGTGTVVARLELGCFGQLHVTVDGEPLKVTLDPTGWDRLIDRVAASAR